MRAAIHLLLLAPAAHSLTSAIATINHLPRGRQTVRCCSSPNEEPRSQTPLSAVTAAEVDATTWPDVGAGCALFFLLQISTLSTLQAVGITSGGAVIPTLRVFVTAAFVAIQQAAGLPADRWLMRSPAAQRAEQASYIVSFLRSPGAPVAAALAFALAVAAAGTASGATWLPEPRALPGLGRAVDVLGAAPLTEEIFFRAWLLEACERVAAPPAIATALSATTFTLWHIQQCSGPADALFFAALGAWLALLYQRSENSLPLVAGTHASFNLIVLLLRAAQMG